MKEINDKILYESIPKGVKEAYWRIGPCYLSVQGETFNWNETIAFCKKAFNKNPIEGIFFLARNDSFHEIYDNAQFLVEFLAKQNQSSGFHFHGSLHYFGYVQKNLGKQRIVGKLLLKEMILIFLIGQLISYQLYSNFIILP